MILAANDFKYNIIFFIYHLINKLSRTVFLQSGLAQRITAWSLCTAYQSDHWLTSTYMYIAESTGSHENSLKTLLLTRVKLESHAPLSLQLTFLRYPHALCRSIEGKHLKNHQKWEFSPCGVSGAREGHFISWQNRHFIIKTHITQNIVL